MKQTSSSTLALEKKKAGTSLYRLLSQLRKGGTIALTLLGTVIILVPIYWMINAAIRPIREVLTVPPKIIPTEITFEYLKTILESARYQQHFINSGVITGTALILTLIIATLAAYGYSRFRMPGGRFFLMGMMVMLMVPRVTLIIPLFRVANITNLYDTRLALILTNTAFALPISTWLLKGYIDSISPDLEEAAMIDGCSRLTAIRRILLPIIFPGLVGVAALVIINSWNDFLIAFTLTQTMKAQPITIALAKFFGEYNRNWNGIMSVAMISSIPLMLLYVFFQRYVVQGLTSGSVK